MQEAQQFVRSGGNDDGASNKPAALFVDGVTEPVQWTWRWYGYMDDRRVAWMLVHKDRAYQKPHVLNVEHVPTQQPVQRLFEGFLACLQVHVSLENGGESVLVVTNQQAMVNTLNKWLPWWHSCRFGLLRPVGCRPETVSRLWRPIAQWWLDKSRVCTVKRVVDVRSNCVLRYLQYKATVAKLATPTPTPAVPVIIPPVSVAPHVGGAEQQHLPTVVTAPNDNAVVVVVDRS